MSYQLVLAFLDVPPQKNEVNSGKNSNVNQSSSDLIGAKMKVRQQVFPDFRFEIYHLKDYAFAVSNNSNSKHSNASDNTTANINCTNFQYNVSCRTVCKPSEQVCPSQAGPNSTSTYSTLGRLQEH
ncbi:MAG: hypothetical protein E6K94_01620 [Thaumarchaeota archaeon]|nr:MAG: hypothetical protein E6K94_01620 [Nitrososphaerota archaeon]